MSLSQPIGLAKQASWLPEELIFFFCFTSILAACTVTTSKFSELH